MIYPSKYEWAPKEYDFVISNAGSDLTFIRAAVKFLGDFTLVSDYGIGIASHSECKHLDKDGYVKVRSYWGPREGSFGILMDKEKFSYSKTIDKIRLAYRDFEKGWYAAIKSKEDL